MFVKEMGKKKPKGIKVGMTRDEAKQLLASLQHVCGYLPGAWKTEQMDKACELQAELQRALRGT